MQKFKQFILLILLLATQNVMSQNLPTEILKYKGQFSAECTGNYLEKTKFVSVHHHESNDSILISFTEDGKTYGGSFSANNVSKHSYKEKVKFDFGGCKLNTYSTKITESELSYSRTRKSCWPMGEIDFEDTLRIDKIDKDTLNLAVTDASSRTIACKLARQEFMAKNN